MPRLAPVTKSTLSMSCLLQNIGDPVTTRVPCLPKQQPFEENAVSRSVDYYFAPQSPWTYLGHQRFCDIARASGAAVRVLPIDLGGKVFPISGGLPVGKRAPQRQAYRLVELQRYSEFLHAPLNLKPKYFPVNGDDAARLIIAVDLHDGTRGRAEDHRRDSGGGLGAGAPHRRREGSGRAAERAGPEPGPAGAVAQPGRARTLRRQHPASHRRRGVRRAQLCDRR
jgi:hypothetical protein